ncbi:MAG: S9 family peptidase [Flavobacteriales bacterium]|nr:S9 family peptidase [Flavobacteriales bacterium]|tara:strand:- start:16022 stop:18172 length:2151 start_codon:yes stop_codon:yes gene_type:complete
MKKLLTLLLSFLLITPISAQKKEITLEDLWKNYSFYPKSYRGIKSMNDGEHYSKMEKTNSGQEIIKYQFKDGKKVHTLFKSTDFEIPTINAYMFSDDEKKLLLKTETRKIYRYSSESVYYIYNIFTDKLKKLSNEKVMYATFSPNANKVAYVFENNLYIKNIRTNKITQVTNDGRKNYIINGASDWVYEEEFALVRSFEWAPDGENIAYYKFDESHVKEFSMDLFKGGLYPTQEVFKYPKAGEENSVVKIYLYNLKEEKNTFLYTKKDYEYFPRIKWTNNPNKLIVFGMNRHQNELDFIIVNASDCSNTVLFTEKDKYFIDIHDNLTFLPEENFIWTSEKDGFNHIYIKNLNGSEQQITNGKWEVTSFEGVDSDNMQVYYRSTEEGSINRTLYVQNLITGEKRKLSTQLGDNSVRFSKNMKYYINSYSNANTAPYYTLHKSNGKQLKVLEDNAEFNTKMEQYDLSEMEFLTIKTTDTELNAWMIKPPNFNKNKEYPLYMFLYGGPGSQQVTNSFWTKNYWHQMLAQNGYIVACVDNRGTGGKGSEFKKMTYKELGKFETIDQINAAKYFGNLAYIDSERIGIQGWSYGGYMSSLAITKGADIFSLAIAVAPVTNWRYYDNIYTERYMQTPQENASGYDENSPINHVEKLKGDYLLIHGSADDNVHVQNSMEMISALVKANKQFDLFIYPDKNHGIYGGNTRYHLYKKMTDFILDNL